MTGDIEYQWIPAKQLDTVSSIDRSQFEHILEKSDQLSEDHYFLCATRENKTIAIAKLYMPPKANNLHIEFLEVAKAERGTHLSRLVLGKLYENAMSQQKTITSDGFTGDGRRLWHIHEDFRKIYGPDAYAVIGRC